MKMAEIIRLHGHKRKQLMRHTPYAIIVKPRKDLKIEYPCEVRMEDGAIIVIDGERAERVAE